MSRGTAHNADIHVEHGEQWSACSARGAGRQQNSDALAVSTGGRCLAFVIADGVGSLAASPLASEVAATAAAAWIDGRRSIDAADVPSLAASVNEAVRAALAAPTGGPGATTLACALVDGERAILATVGDSEVLAIGDEGPAQRLNELDHLPARPNMLLAWIDGDSPFEPHVISLDPLPSRVCLATDGIIKVLDYDRIAVIVRKSPPAEAARALVMEAGKRGATDDVTALVFSRDVAKSIARRHVA